MDALDLAGLYLDEPWEWAPAREVVALLHGVPDPASVAMLATTMPADLSPRLCREVEQAVRERYAAFTRAGAPDGP